MFYIVNDKGDYQEFAHAKTIEEAQIELHARLTDEEIKREGWEVFDDTRIRKFYVVNRASDIWSEAFSTREEAERELQEETQHLYGTDAEVVEVIDNE